MINLRKIVYHLDNATFKNVEDNLIRNKADNFLYLLKSFKNEVAEKDIAKNLKLSSNSYSVLKSRLYDKIQEHLTSDIAVSRHELINNLENIKKMAYTQIKELNVAFLLKLERDLLRYDMHHELIFVYSALKKVHIYSEKYYYFSQLYNKQVAYNLSIEKCEELLSNFNRIFAEYHFSRESGSLDAMLFIQKEISDHLTLNPSRRIEAIKNIINLHLGLFCNPNLVKNGNTESLLHLTRELILEMPESTGYQHWLPALDFLFFEFYYRNNRAEQANEYYNKIMSTLPNLLLFTNICSTSLFLMTRITFLSGENRIQEIIESKLPLMNSDEDDKHTQVMIGMHEAMISFYSGLYKDACVKLNELLNENSFKHYFHIAAEIKLTLALIYIYQRDYKMASTIIINLARKIRVEKLKNYYHVLNLIKLFEGEIKKKSGTNRLRQEDYFTLFSVKNVNEHKILQHLDSELKRKFTE